MIETERSILAHITGRVQGVSFRAWTRQEAMRLGLTGWVRNETDGSVTALLSGPRGAVDAMTQLIWQGPPAAVVSDVRIEESKAHEPLTGFEVRY